MLVRRSLLLVLLLFVAQVVPVAAWIRRTPEGVALGNISSSIRAFESENGRLPESWKELDDKWKRPLDVVFPEVLPTRRYELFSPPLDLRLYGRSAQVIAITRKPMWEQTWKGSMGRAVALKGPGRYIVRRTESGYFASEWFPETAIQRLWAGTGHALPIPDDEPERPWVKSARWQIMIRRAGIGVAVALVAAWIIARLRRKGSDAPLS